MLSESSREKGYRTGMNDNSIDSTGFLIRFFIDSLSLSLSLFSTYRNGERKVEVAAKGFECQ